MGRGGAANHLRLPCGLMGEGSSILLVGSPPTRGARGGGPAPAKAAREPRPGLAVFFFRFSRTALPRAKGMHQPRDSALFFSKQTATAAAGD